MPSFQDSAVIFVLALLLFGPKKLPELARYLGKLMGEFRRASSEFRLQMEDEFRIAERAEQAKKVAAIEAAAPVAPSLIPEPEHPHMPAVPTSFEPAAPELLEDTITVPEHSIDARPEKTPEPLPIASAGDLHLMPPATGLPVARGNGATPKLEPEPEEDDLFGSIPRADAGTEAHTNA